MVMRQKWKLSIALEEAVRLDILGLFLLRGLMRTLVVLNDQVTLLYLPLLFL